MRNKTYRLRDINGAIQIESLLPLTEARLRSIKADLTTDELSRVVGWRLVSSLLHQTGSPMSTRIV